MASENRFAILDSVGDEELEPRPKRSEKMETKKEQPQQQQEPRPPRYRRIRAPRFPERFDCTEWTKCPFWVGLRLPFRLGATFDYTFYAEGNRSSSAKRYVPHSYLFPRLEGITLDRLLADPLTYNRMLHMRHGARFLSSTDPERKEHTTAFLTSSTGLKRTWWLVNNKGQVYAVSKTLLVMSGPQPPKLHEWTSNDGKQQLVAPSLEAFMVRFVFEDQLSHLLHTQVEAYGVSNDTYTMGLVDKTDWIARLIDIHAQSMHPEWNWFALQYLKALRQDYPRARVPIVTCNARNRRFLSHWRSLFIRQPHQRNRPMTSVYWSQHVAAFQHARQQIDDAIEEKRAVKDLSTQKDDARVVYSYMDPTDRNVASGVDHIEEDDGVLVQGDDATSMPLQANDARADGQDDAPEWADWQDDGRDGW